MNKLPIPILGEITALTITSPDLEKSLVYYQKLGFSEVFRADWPFPWIQVSDGVLLIMLRQDPIPYIALTYYVKDINKVSTDLKKKGIQFEKEPKKTDPIKRYLLQSPDGLNISLVSLVDGFSQPPGPGMLEMQPQDYFNPEKYINKTCGLFGELAHPVAALEKSLEFWQLLGFTTVSKFSSPYPWAIISDGLSIVGLHQSTEFSYPAITYFAADMQDKITALKKAGLKDYMAKGPSDIVLTTPEQQHIFLFKLGGPDLTPKKKRELKQPVIETKRLLLKELNPEIMNELFSSYADEYIISFLGLPDNEALETKKKQWQQGLTTYSTSFKNFLMEEKATGKLIGRCGFRIWHLLHNRAELGYAMADDSVKGKGYMKEALRRIITYGFEEMGLNRQEGFVGPKNVPSLKLLRGAGFIEEGTLRAHYFKNGKMEDSICFSLLRAEYDAVKDSWKPLPASRGAR